MKIRIGTDCSGIEAPIQALERLGLPYQHCFASESHPKVRELLKINYHPEILFEDMTQRDHTQLPSIDLYMAGFPCQSFSSLGKRQGLQGSDIFFHVYHTIKACQPKVFLLENVKGLLHHDGGKTWQIIQDHLNTLEGYQIHHRVLNSKDYGLPQWRERIYILGLKTTFSKEEFHWPEPIPLKVQVTDLIEPNLPKKRMTPHEQKILHEYVEAGKITSLDDPWIVNLGCSSHKHGTCRLNISPCLVSSGMIYYLTSEERNLTPEEYLKLQGFHCLQRGRASNRLIYHVAGNAMSVNVVASILGQIYRSSKRL